jgi:hypothetical protein
VEEEIRFYIFFEKGNIMGIQVFRKNEESAEARSQNFVEINNVMYWPSVIATFKLTGPSIMGPDKKYLFYNTLEFILASPSSKKNSKRINDIGRYDIDIVDYFKNSLSKEISAEFLYPEYNEYNEGILLTQEQINTLYIPLLKAISNHVKNSR